jgi:hypothetical protein
VQDFALSIPAGFTRWARCFDSHVESKRQESNMVRDKRRAATKWMLLVSALSGAWGVNGCSQQFENCEAARSCRDPGVPGAGEGGEGGEAGGAGSSGEIGSESGGADGSAGAENETARGGAGGESASPDGCREDSDCSDGKACNGEEVCRDGECEDGETPCENPDSEHCSVECSEGDSGAECVVSALDEDGDGHGTLECIEAPGDDCNDTLGTGEAIFPGAPEVCNANVDDDCDGLDDGADDIVLPGSSIALVSSEGLGTTERGQAAISRGSNSGSGFGVAWTDFRHEDDVTNSEIYFRTLGSSGVLGGEERLTQATTAKDKRFPSIVVNNTGSYRVVWLYAAADDGTPGIATRTTTSSSTNQNLSLPEIVGRPKLAEASGGSGTVFIARNHATPSSDGFSRLEFDSGGFSQPSSTLLAVPAGQAQSFDVGATGGNSFLVASVLDLDGVGKVSGSWESGAEIAVNSSNVSETDVVAGANLFAYRETSLENGASRIVLRAVNGTLCSVGLADGIPVALSEAALLYWDAEGKALYAKTITSASSCTVGPSALVVEQSEERVVSEPDVANDGSTVLVSWTEHDMETDRWSIQGRRFSLDLCQ